MGYASFLTSYVVGCYTFFHCADVQVRFIYAYLFGVLFWQEAVGIVSAVSLPVPRMVTVAYSALINDLLHVAPPI